MALFDRIGQRPFIADGPLLQATGPGWISLVATTGFGYGQLFPPLFAAGIGAGIVFPTILTGALSPVPPADMRKASGANQTLQRFGAVFTFAITGRVFTANGQMDS
ncbi:MAG TPA: hypothetical protein VF221_17115 [Chloroflexota bacterium]